LQYGNFERIQLPEADFEVHLLEWEIPRADESLAEYAKRIAEKIKLENPVLIGFLLVVFWFKKWQSTLILEK
jgi:hypothetical protein